MPISLFRGVEQAQDFNRRAAPFQWAQVLHMPIQCPFLSDCCRSSPNQVACAPSPLPTACVPACRPPRTSGTSWRRCGAPSASALTWNRSWRRAHPRQCWQRWMGILLMRLRARVLAFVCSCLCLYSCVKLCLSVCTCMCVCGFGWVGLLARAFVPAQRKFI